MHRHSFARLGPLLAVLTSLAACQAQPQWASPEPQNGPVFPGESWAKAAVPEDMGWSSDVLAEARAFSEEIGSTAVMIVQNGIVVDAWGEVATKSNLHSVRKSLLSGLIGLAVDRGQIDLSASLAALGIDDNAPSLTEAEKTATVADLIKARSGVYHPALYETRQMTESKPARGSHAPGSFWHYNNWDFNTLGTIYEQETGGRIFEDFAREFAAPLQMEDFEVGDGEYFTGAKSIHPAYPFRMTARDLGRVALLYLRKGEWNGHQVLSAKWVEESTSTHSHLSDSYVSGYGYMWWTGDGDRLFPNVVVPGRSYFASGWGRQHAIVIPSLDLIVVHRVNTDWAKEHPSHLQVGRLLWLILEAAGVSGHGPDPSAERAAGLLDSGTTLAQTLKGTSWSGKNQGNDTPWRLDFGASGDLAGAIGHYDKAEDSGTWRVDGERYCLKWSNWSGGKENCFRLAVDGDRAKAFDDTGTLVKKMRRIE